MDTQIAGSKSYRGFWKTKQSVKGHIRKVLFVFLTFGYISFVVLSLVLKGEYLGTVHQRSATHNDVSILEHHVDGGRYRRQAASSDNGKTTHDLILIDPLTRQFIWITIYLTTNIAICSIVSNYLVVKFLQYSIVNINRLKGLWTSMDICISLLAN